MSLKNYYKPHDPTIEELMDFENGKPITLDKDLNTTFPMSQKPHPGYKKIKGWIIAIIAFLILIIPAYNIQKTNREGDYARARVILKTENWGKEWIHSQNGFKTIEEFLETHVKMPAGHDLYPNSYIKPENLKIKDFSDQDSNAYTVLEVTEKWSPHYKQLVIKPKYTDDQLGSDLKTWIKLDYKDFSRKNDFEQYGGLVCISIVVLFVGISSGILRLRRSREELVIGGAVSFATEIALGNLSDAVGLGGSSDFGGGFSSGRGGRKF